ncbi:hypothetical protein G9P44_002757 [Scheffersomyces stipitis]|nr:hypothetical protein G9P44_002757 [Scheffersomyces stipitis]
MTFSTLHFEGENTPRRTDRNLPLSMNSPQRSPYNSRLGLEKSTLFTNREGRSIRFYMEYSEPRRLHYKALIETHGGVLLDHSVTDCFWLSTNPLTGRRSYRVQYIDDCVRLVTLQDIRIYSHPDFNIDTNLLHRGAGDTTSGMEMDPTSVAAAVVYGDAQPNPNLSSAADLPSDFALATAGTSLSPGTAPKVRTHNRFTPQKDAFILEEVRKHPRARHSHEFFRNLAKNEILKGHTGNSVRSRFRKHLEANLQYVYQQESDGNPSKDAHGNYIPTKELPQTLKNKYTAEDDYYLCTEAKKYILAKESAKDGGEGRGSGKLPELKVLLPYSFFSNLCRPDRGGQDEVADSENNPDKRNKKHIGQRHTLHSWRDRYRKFVGDGTIEKYIKSYEASENPKPLERRGVINSSSLNNMTGELREIVGSNARNREERALDEEIGQTKSSLIGVPDLNMSAGDVLESLEPIERPTMREIEEDEEIIEDIEVDDIEDIEDFQDASTQLSSIQANFEDAVNHGSQDSQSVMKYIGKGVKFEDLFTDPSVLNYDLVSKLNTALRSISDDVQELAECLEELGFKQALVEHLLYSTCCDKTRLFFLFRHIYNNLQDNLVSDGHIPVYELLQPPDEGGFWTKEQDDLLQAGRDDALEVQNKRQIRTRREFLNKL